jgi:formylglycine-generating enzyme required for sulfatase activity
MKNSIKISKELIGKVKSKLDKYNDYPVSQKQHPMAIMNYIETINDHSFEMVYVQGGSFIMGDGLDYDNPKHKVTLSNFLIARYPVTQKLWKAVMGENPSYFQGDNLPVEQVSWEDAQAFIARLNTFTDKIYKLPSEAQWEYAAIGGIYKDEHSLEYAGSNQLEEVAWYNNNSERKTHPVGQKKPNALGLYDMSGNVFEWCMDAYDSDFYKSHEAKKLNPLNGNYEFNSYRCLRGGSWYNDFFNCRVRSRLNFYPRHRYNGSGFRLVMTL